MLEDARITTTRARGVRGRATIMYSKFHESGFHAWASRVLRACRQAATHRSTLDPHDASSVPTGGSLVSTPVPRCGWPALILGALRAPVLLGWPRDKAHA